MDRLSKENGWVMSKPDSSEIGGFGENYVSGELERRKWITCLPTRDVGIDRIAFKLTEGQFKYLFVQVKTAIWSEKSNYTLTVRRTKAYEDSNFVFIFVLVDETNPKEVRRARFLVLTTSEWKKIMGKSLKTKSWNKGSYTFHIPKDLGKWEQFLNKFEKLDHLKYAPSLTT
jgi:hypothetical protein